MGARHRASQEDDLKNNIPSDIGKLLGARSSSTERGSENVGAASTMRTTGRAKPRYASRQTGLQNTTCNTYILYENVLGSVALQSSNPPPFPPRQGEMFGLKEKQPLIATLADRSSTAPAVDPGVGR